MLSPSSRHGAMTNERNLTMRSPRPVEGRARNYGYQGSLSDGCLSHQMGCFKHTNSYSSGFST